MRKDEAKSILLKTIPCPYQDNEKICHHLQEGGGDCESCYEEALYTILDLVEKQQKEIEELKKDKKDNIQVIYGGRRFGTEGMVVKDYINKDKIREKIKELRKEEDEIEKLDYTAEPEKAIDVVLLRIADLNELLEEK